MNYLSVAEIARNWRMSPRSVRNYCSQNKIEGAFLTGKTWNIPSNAKKPARKNSRYNPLLDSLKLEKLNKIRGGIYQELLVELTYSSKTIEGGRLSKNEIQYMVETNTIKREENPINIDLLLEYYNHFECINLIIDKANSPLNEKTIKDLHFILKQGTSDSHQNWFSVGNYKKIPIEDKPNKFIISQDIKDRVKTLIKDYNSIKKKSLDDIITFHYKFEEILPFQDGNGVIGRLIMFKECLGNNISPFIISEDLKWDYYCGLKDFTNDKEILLDACKEAQSDFKKYLEKYGIE
jgi:Fic family protein